MLLIANIIFVDEAIHEIRPFVVDLGIRGLKVTTCRTADDCLDVLLAGCNAGVFILDVMLLSRGAFTSEDTEGYRYTGLLLGRIIRELYPHTPIVFFSAISSKDSLRYVDLTVETLGNSTLIRKHEIASPFEFADQICPILETGRVHRQARSVLGAAADSLLVEPNVAGIGFDVKGFVKRLLTGKGR